jgi:hypothetical protein
MAIVLALRVALVFLNPAPIDAAVLRHAVAEATAIWAPYGLNLQRRDVCAPSDETLQLTVGLSGVVGRHRPVVLGTVAFRADGTPEPGITLFLDEVLRFVAGTRFMGSPEWAWPVVLRERIVGRVLGRVLAHEIGHYVLRSRVHTATGLMRSVQRSDELAAPPRAGFTLSPAEAAALDFEGRTLKVWNQDGTNERADTCGRP